MVVAVQQEEFFNDDDNDNDNNNTGNPDLEFWHFRDTSSRTRD